MGNELSIRLFRFAVDVIKFLRLFDNSVDIKIIKYQLIKAATSSGANYEEAQGGSSKSDFTNKVTISLKEMRESNYWLRIIKSAQLYPLKTENVLDILIQESTELKKILGSIVVKSKENQ